MPTYPLPTLSAQVTTAGVSAPSYVDILLSLQAQFQSIYGSDAYLAEDSQDGQFLAILAQVIYDCDQMVIATYNSFSPSTAIGAGLSSVVKINGLMRNLSSNSQVTVTLTGTPGAVITDGKVADLEGNVWDLPHTVTLGVGGTVSVTATAEVAGSIRAAPNTVTKIRTPTLGWFSVTNTGSASAGEPVEEDPALRARQSRSVALPSLSVFDGIVAAIEALPGVVEVSGVDNDTDTTDAQGVPGHSIALVVDGGDAQSIGNAIALKKGPGASTYGTTAVVVVDSVGISKSIHFFRPTDENIRVELSFKALQGYTSTIGNQARQAVADYINSLRQGQDVLVTRLYLPAQLFGGAGSSTYELLSAQAGLALGSVGSVDIPIALDKRANVVTLDDIALTVS